MTEQLSSEATLRDSGTGISNSVAIIDKTNLYLLCTCFFFAGIAITIAVITLIMSQSQRGMDMGIVDQRYDDLVAQFRNTQDRVEVCEIYMNNLHADLKARGFDIPKGTDQ